MINKNCKFHFPNCDSGTTSNMDNSFVSSTKSFNSNNNNGNNGNSGKQKLISRNHYGRNSNRDSHKRRNINSNNNNNNNNNNSNIYYKNSLESKKSSIITNNSETGSPPPITCIRVLRPSNDLTPVRFDSHYNIIQTQNEENSDLILENE
jgi:hypothetical protein